MFTGIIEEVSRVENFISNSNGAVVYFRAPFKDTRLGDSIALNGVCLSITSIKDDLFSADIMPETLKISTLKTLKKGDLINLERAVKITSRLDGHIVSGHIDTVAKTKSIIQDGFSKRITFNCNTDLIILKGSIAINGTSLTISGVEEDSFEVSLIPATLQSTNLKNLKIGDIVNIEYDLFAKYIQKFTQKPTKKEITLEFLKENGF